MSRWYEPIDRQPGAHAIIRSQPAAGEITYELPVVGVRKTQRRVFLRCSDDGTITLRLLLGQERAT